nr:immunoglobulin M [Paralichthys olivaceus]
MFPVAVLLLLAAGSYVKCETLTQPASVTVRPGQPLTISCQVSYSVSSYHTGWIRQPAGKGLEWIGSRRSGGDTYYKESLKNKFSIDLDTSSNTVSLKGQNMQPGDTAVYYCARHTAWARHFDYWGKGTMVTVTSATPAIPTLFPVMPCGSGTGQTVTLGCLATGFTPSSLTFAWDKNGAALTDAIQYPSVLKGNFYTGVSQIRVPRQEWDNSRPFKCTVTHEAGSPQITLQKPKVLFSSPELKVSAFYGEKNEASFFCSAENFSPKDYQIKWMKNGDDFTDIISEITTSTEEHKSENGTLYSATSILRVHTSDLPESAKIKCQFKGKDASGVKLTEAFVTYKPITCTKGCMEADVDVYIEGPTEQDMLVDKTGTIKCHVKVKNPTVMKIYWENHDGEEIPDATLKPNGRGDSYIVPVDITYDEWSQGIKLNCVVEHSDWFELLRTPYERSTGVQTQRPSVFMMPPVEHVKKDTVTLTCYVKDFSPPEVFVSWLVDDEYPSGYKFNTTNPIESNGSYSAYGQLSLSLEQWKKEGVMYSCVVYHQSVVNNTKAIVRSIGHKTSETTNLVNLNMNIPCKAQ